MRADSYYYGTRNITPYTTYCICLFIFGVILCTLGLAAAFS